MEVIVTNHAKKRIKQRVHKNWQKAAEDAYRYGLDHSRLKGRLKRHINWVALNRYKHTAKITAYKIYGGDVYLFKNNVLITVFHLPSRFVNLARRLTEQNIEEITTNA